jgi:hypothetical protein
MISPSTHTTHVVFKSCLSLILSLDLYLVVAVFNISFEKTLKPAN